MCPPGVLPIQNPELSGSVAGPRAGGHRPWCRRGPDPRPEDVLTVTLGCADRDLRRC